MTLIHNIGMFLLGIRDSLSLGWLLTILFCYDKTTKRFHPSCSILFNSLKSAIIQVFIYIFVIPHLLNYLGIYYIAFALRGLFLVLSYGYLFFHNQDILKSTRDIIVWRQRKNPGTNFQLDAQYKIQTLTYISGQIRGFIFLVFYYLPIVVITTLLTVIPYFGMFTVIISEAFFNSAFFFLSTWPYDKYNAAFIQKQKYYMLGFGMLVSVVCNYFLSGFEALGVCMMISLWMLINSVVYSPIQTQFTTFVEIWRTLTKANVRNGLGNGYNIHRRRVAEQPDYRRSLLEQNTFLVGPALKITQYINSKIQGYFLTNNGATVVSHQEHSH